MGEEKIISVIIVTFNSKKTLERALLSVIEQQGNCYEIIVIDGGSTDGTVEILKKYNNKIKYYCSEPDNGIYDAMNKGMSHASGEYVYFLGSDDWLVSDEVLKNVASYIGMHPGKDFYYGNIYMYNEELGMRKFLKGYRTSNELLSGKMIPHQAMFMKCDTMENIFQTKYKLAADFALVLKRLQNGASFQYIDLLVAYYNVSGASSTCTVYDEYIDILKKYSDDFAIKNKLREKQSVSKKYTLNRFLKFLICMLIGRRAFKWLTGWENVSTD